MFYKETANQLGRNDINSLHGNGGEKQLNLQILAEVKILVSMTAMENELKLLKLKLVRWPLPLQLKHVKVFVLVLHNARPALLVCQPYPLPLLDNRMQL